MILFSKYTFPYICLYTFITNVLFSHLSSFLLAIVIFIISVYISLQKMYFSVHLCIFLWQMHFYLNSVYYFFTVNVISFASIYASLHQTFFPLHSSLICWNTTFNKAINSSNKHLPKDNVTYTLLWF